MSEKLTQAALYEHYMRRALALARVAEGEDDSLEKLVETAEVGRLYWGMSDPIPLQDDVILSPGQGFLPEYDAGLYQVEHTQLIVSRGLGNSSIPWRINNPPHLPMLVLSAKET